MVSPSAAAPLSSPARRKRNRWRMSRVRLQRHVALFLSGQIRYCEHIHGEGNSSHASSDCSGSPVSSESFHNVGDYCQGQLDCTVPLCKMISYTARVRSFKGLRIARVLLPGRLAATAQPSSTTHRTPQVARRLVAQEYSAFLFDVADSLGLPCCRAGAA